MKTGIYTIINLIDSKMYVGYCFNSVNRKAKHFETLRKNTHFNHHLQRAVNKYGIENFEFEMLEECEKDFLASQEHYWATLLNVHNRQYGYNISPTNPYKQVSFSHETIEKFKNKFPNRKGVALSQETKDKISKAKKNPSKELRNKISFSLKEYYKINKCSNIGRKASEEEKLKISKSKIGKKGYWEGKKRSDEDVIKMSVNNKQNKKVRNKETGELYYNISEACRKLNLIIVSESKRLKKGKSKILEYV